MSRKDVIAISSQPFPTFMLPALFWISSLHLAFLTCR